MFGVLRFFLAILVVLSHLNIGIYIPGIRRFNPGIFAVVFFYILSGYVMAYLFTNKFDFSLKKTRQFYTDRLLRIFPQYLFFAMITILFIALTGFGNSYLSVKHLILNLLIVPLNYYMFFDLSILQAPKSWLIPPGWSLGAELQFYALIPFLLFIPKLRFFVSGASLITFILASFGVIHTEYFGYRLLPGILFIFLSGSFIFYSSLYNHKELKNNKIARGNLIAICVIYGIVLSLVLVLQLSNKLFVSTSFEVIMGLIVGIPLITFLSQKSPEHPLDKFLGNLSYGVFLNHFLVIWLLDFFVFHNKGIVYGKPFQIFVILLFSITLSYLSYILLDKPIRGIRRRWRSSLS